MLRIVTFWWGDKWGPEYARRLLAGVKRNLKQPFEFIVATDGTLTEKAAALHLGPGSTVTRILDPDLTQLRGCFARMRLFDAGWQRELSFERGDKIVCLDLDIVVTGALDRLFRGNHEFRIMQGYNATNPCPFNGSMWMFRVGERHDVWTDFSLENYSKRNLPYHAFPDDQGWLHHKFPDAAAFTVSDGVYAFKKLGWGAAGRRVLPIGARVVAFPGRDPAKYPQCDWIVKNWLAA